MGQHIAAGIEIHIALSAKSTSVGLANSPRHCPTISTGVNVVERAHRCCSSIIESAPAAPAKPATTRVTILTGRRMTDVVLPSAAPIETYIDETVAVLAEILEDTPSDILAGFDFSAQGAWTLARPGAPPLKPDQSLDDAVVVDGSLLTLVPVSRTERYRPLVEDVIDAIAVLDESPEFDRSALNRFVGVAIPFVNLAVTVIAALAWWHTGRQLWWPLGLGVGGFVALVGSWAAARFYRKLESFGEPAGDGVSLDRRRCGAGHPATARGRLGGRAAACRGRRDCRVLDAVDPGRPSSA